MRLRPLLGERFDHVALKSDGEVVVQARTMRARVAGIDGGRLGRRAVRFFGTRSRGGAGGPDGPTGHHEGRLGVEVDGEIALERLPEDVAHARGERQVVALAELGVCRDPVFERRLAALLGIPRPVSGPRFVPGKIGRSKVRLELIGIDRVRQDDREVAMCLTAWPRHARASQVGQADGTIRAKRERASGRRAERAFPVKALGEGEPDLAVERERRLRNEQDGRVALRSRGRVRSPHGEDLPLYVGLPAGDQARGVLDLGGVHRLVELDLKRRVRPDVDGALTRLDPDDTWPGRRELEPVVCREDVAVRRPRSGVDGDDEAGRAGERQVRRKKEPVCPHPPPCPGDGPPRVGRDMGRGQAVGVHCNWIVGGTVEEHGHGGLPKVRHRPSRSGEDDRETCPRRRRAPVRDRLEGP